MADLIILAFFLIALGGLVGFLAVALAQRETRRGAVRALAEGGTYSEPYQAELRRHADHGLLTHDGQGRARHVCLVLAWAALVPAVISGHPLYALAVALALVGLLMSLLTDALTRWVYAIVLPITLGVVLLRIMDSLFSTTSAAVTTRPLISALGGPNVAGAISPWSAPLGVLVLGLVALLIWVLPGWVMARLRGPERDPDTGETITHAGLGDVYLWLLLGAVLGPVDGLIATVVAIFLNSLVAAALLVRRVLSPRLEQRHMPYGPGLVIAAVLMLSGVIGR